MPKLRVLLLAMSVVFLGAAARACTAPTSAHAGAIASGPVLSFGYTDKLRRNLYLPGLGWRWQFGPGETLGGWGRRIGTDLTFAVEPMVAGIFGDKTSFEAQVVPFVHLVPSAMRDRQWRPYFEGGIGIIYTGLEDLRLGSHVLFSDNLGIGFTFGREDGPRWSRVSIGYRYRHISHAGLFGHTNTGMNTHAIVFTID